MTTSARRLRLVSVTLMACEADIAEAFVRWTVPFVDRLYVCLNNSYDGTADILRALQDEGLPLVLQDAGRARFDQSELTHRLMGEAAQDVQPDWVLPLDADEFLDCPDRDTLERALQQHGSRHARIAWVNHAPTDEDDWHEINPIRRIRHRYEYPAPDPHRNPNAWKTIVNVPLLRPYEGRYRIAMGNHFVQWRGIDRESAQPNAPLPGIRLRHFPLRSADQALLKAGLGAASRTLHFGHSDDFAMQWKRLATALTSSQADRLPLLQEGVREYLDFGRFTPNDLRDTPLVEDGLEPTFSLRYSGLGQPTAVALLAWIQGQLAPAAVTGERPARRGGPRDHHARAPSSSSSAHHPYLWRRLSARVTEGVGSGYPDTPRPELLALISNPGNAFLDVGCWTGATAAAIKQRYPDCSVSGIERDPRALAIARGRLDSVVEGDLEASPGPDAHLADSAFTTVLCADVLEHLVDPWSLLLRLRRLLAPGGRLVVSVPNVFNLQLIDNLARERWDYAPDGLLDLTHLRFFTRETLGLMLQETGYTVRSFHALPSGPEGIPRHERRALGVISTSAVTLEGLDPDRLDRLFALQHVAIATAG